MEFVGREKEIDLIHEALEGGNHVILKGKYGIGRTSLVRHVAKVMQREWRFLLVDFSQGPAWAARHLVAEIWPQGTGRGRPFSRSYRAVRSQLVHRALIDPRRHAIVLDNIGALSAQRLGFIRYVARSERFRLVAVVEGFVGERELFRLRMELFPALLVTLVPLLPGEVRAFLRCASAKYGLGWTESRINGLAEVVRGYPLGMKERVQRELQRRKGVEPSGGTAGGDPTDATEEITAAKGPEPAANAEGRLTHSLCRGEAPTLSARSDHHDGKGPGKTRCSSQAGGREHGVDDGGTQ
jgi:hypothetical protein